MRIISTTDTQLWYVSKILLLGCCCVFLTGQTLLASDLRQTAEVRAVREAAPSVVNIHGQKTVNSSADPSLAFDGPRKVNGMGTGVVIDPRGYIITNYHVVEGVRKIEVSLSGGETHIGKLISHDQATDLAIVKINADRELPVIRIGTSSDLMHAEPVIAMGNAFGYEHTVTRGIISALHRSVQISETQSYEDLIQTDASINPGNSGGPLLNIDGEMIGINVAVRAGAQGIGFAIPVDKAMAIASNLLSSQRTDNIWHGLVAKDNVVSAYVVASVDSSSPAGEAGLKSGDIITQVDTLAIHRPLDFERALIDRKPGDSVDVTVKRNEESISLNLMLSATQRNSFRPVSTSGDIYWDVLGMRLSPVSKEAFEKYQSRHRGGLQITAVRPDGPAAKQGIRRGDVLIGMHLWETISLDNVSYILNRDDFSSFEPIKFYILRGGDSLLVGHLKVSGESETR